MSLYNNSLHSLQSLFLQWLEHDHDFYCESSPERKCVSLSHLLASPLRPGR